MEEIQGMPNRKDFLPHLDTYVTKYEKVTGTNVVGLRLDGASKFKSYKTVAWARTRGITLEYTTYYTLQQNGRSKRINRTIFDGVRAILVNAEAQLEFWEDAAMTFVYCRNRCWKKSIGITPYEKWHGKKPDISNLRVWFSIAVALIPPEKKEWHKLLPHGFKGILVGYGGSGYRIFDPVSRKIVTSNHCSIHENQRSSAYLRGFEGYTEYPMSMPTLPAPEP
jgi:hypothetical protein